jgi:predicted alpha/beta-fold hydrolase
LIANPHLATIASNFWPRHRELRSVPEIVHRVAVSDGVSIRVVEQRPSAPARGQLVLVHGLEGSSDSGYMRSLAWSALEEGYTVHRLNIRGCGGTEGWCRTLYHAGLTGDVLHYLRSLPVDPPLTLVGFSLGGNIAMKLAGELGSSAADLLHAVVAVSAPLDLAACVRALANPANYLYEHRFVVSMRKRLEERHRLQPGAFSSIFDNVDLRAIRTIYDFDDRITAPHFGFGCADRYYATQSSRNFLESVRIPALLLTAQDDPLIPFDVYSHAAIAANPNFTLIAPKHGGHVAFLAKQKPRFWADEVILTWLRRLRNK